MTNANLCLESLGSADLLSATRELVRKAHGVEADLLAHLGEIDERKLYLECAYPSMFAFCLDELGFSECAAYNRITVARIGRRLPAVIEAVRSGRVHLAGLRVLAPHLTAENHEVILAQSAGKSKREIEELVAQLWPLPPVPASIRKLPENPVARSDATPTSRAFWGNADPPALPNETRPPSPIAEEGSGPAAPPQRDDHRALIAPLSGETFRIQFTATRAFRDKLKEAQDLLRHRVPDGDVSTIIERALDLLILGVKKERFAVGRKARPESSHTVEAPKAGSRHIPDAIKRAVYERDGGRCTFVDEKGRRCSGTAALEFDHVAGFARTRAHAVDEIRLRCRAHNQHAAEQLYGREFMERARGAKARPSTRPGAS